MFSRKCDSALRGGCGDAVLIRTVVKCVRYVAAVWGQMPGNWG